MHAADASSDGPLYVAVEGTLDPMAASAIRARLAGTHRLVVLDLSRAREVHDLGVAVLAHGLAVLGIPAQFRGLSAHHERLLRHLGLDASVAGAPSSR